MNKLNIILLILICILSVFVFLKLSPEKKNYIIIDNQKFYIDVAKTDEQKEKGLSIYNKLPLEKGMIFPYEDSGYHPFWMKGMKFSIDIIYIQNNKIVDIFENLPFPKNDFQTPVIVRPTANSNYVLEINAGLSKKYNFKKGDIVEIHL